MYRDTIQFNKFQLPETFTKTLSGITYEITVDYNSFNDRLYLSIADENGNDLITNWKLVAGEHLFDGITDINLPSDDLVMIDETGKSTTVNFGNINKTIFITIDDTFTGETDPGNTDDGIFNPDGDDSNMGFEDDEDDEDNVSDQDDDFDTDEDLSVSGGVGQWS